MGADLGVGACLGHYGICMYIVYDLRLDLGTFLLVSMTNTMIEMIYSTVLLRVLFPYFVC